MKICPKCGTTNEDGAEFCKACGTPLTAAEMPAKQTLPVKYPWLLKLYGLIFVVICVAICGGFVAKGVSAARANRSKPAADFKSSAPAETGASSRAAGTSRTETSRTDATEGGAAEQFIAAVKAKYQTLLSTNLREVSRDYDESDGSTAYLFSDSGNVLTVSMLEKNNTITLICTRYERETLDWLISKADEEQKILYQTAMLNALYCPIAVFEDSIQSKEDLTLYILAHMETREGASGVKGNGYTAVQMNLDSINYSCVITLS